MANTCASGTCTKACALIRRETLNTRFSWSSLSSQCLRTTNKVPPLLAMAPVRIEKPVIDVTNSTAGSWLIIFDILSMAALVLPGPDVLMSRPCSFTNARSCGKVDFSFGICIWQAVWRRGKRLAADDRGWLPMTSPCTDAAAASTMTQLRVAELIGTGGAVTIGNTACI